MWHSRVTVKHLFTPNDDHESVQASMNAIADVLGQSTAFAAFSRAVLGKMRNIPQGDDYFGPLDYANKLLDVMYNFANEYRIWID